VDGRVSIAHCTTAARQAAAFPEMKRVVAEFLDLWYT